MRSWRPGRMWSSGPWTCGRLVSPARCGNLSRDARLDPAVPDPAGDPAAGSPGRTGEPGAGPDDGHGPDGNDGGPGPGGGPPPGPARGPAGSSTTGRRPGSGPGPSLAALVSITIPWSTDTGRADGLANAGGLGVTDAADAHDLAAAAGRDPRTRWCVTVLNPAGTAAAHGCAPGRHPPPGPHNLTIAPGPAPPPGTSPHDWISQLGIQLTPVSRGTCTHEHAEPGYRPSRKLRHLVRARNDHCTAPGCGGLSAATWTTPWPGKTTASPANATWPRYAVITIALSKPKGGGWNNPNRVS